MHILIFEISLGKILSYCFSCQIARNFWGLLWTAEFFVFLKLESQVKTQKL